MYIIIGAKTEGYNWQTLLPVLEKSVEQSSVTEEYYPQILAALANDGAAVTGISLPQDKDRLAEFVPVKSSKGKYVFLGLPLPVDPKLLKLLSNIEGAAFLLLYPNPGLVMAHMLEQGKTTKQATQHWLTAANDLMTLHRHHRKHSRVLNVESAIQSSEFFFNLCKQHFGLVGKPKSLASVCSEIKIETPDTLHVLIAKQLLQQSEEVAFLVSELAASTTPLGNNPVDDGDIRLNLDKLLQQQVQLSKEKEKIAEENELLLIQLHQVQEELEKYHLQNQNLLKENAQASEENELLLIQLHHIQEELESYYLQSQGLQKEKSQLESSSAAYKKQLTLTQQELLLIKQTFAYRLARPLVNLQQTMVKQREDRRDLRLIQRSDLFDSNWYLDKYQDVKQAGMTPARHYLLYGGAEQRDPGPNFSSKAYIQRYTDVATSGMNPLLHYLRYGQKEGRHPK